MKKIFALILMLAVSPAYAMHWFGDEKQKGEDITAPPVKPTPPDNPPPIPSYSYYAALTGTLGNTLKPGATLGVMHPGDPIDLVAEVLISEQGSFNLLASKEVKKGTRLLGGLTLNSGPGLMVGFDHGKWLGRFSARTTSYKSCSRHRRCSTSSKNENVVSVSYRFWTK